GCSGPSIASKSSVDVRKPVGHSDSKTHAVLSDGRSFQIISGDHISLIPLGGHQHQNLTVRVTMRMNCMPVAAICQV
ncbi:MAG: hypothetical protein WCD63_23425, partial [Terrimicrobiaceae bacterium]